MLVLLKLWFKREAGGYEGCGLEQGGVDNIVMDYTVMYSYGLWGMTDFLGLDNTVMAYIVMAYGACPLPWPRQSAVGS